jgi:hypothetical protein
VDYLGRATRHSRAQAFCVLARLIRWSQASGVHCGSLDRRRAWGERGGVGLPGSIPIEAVQPRRIVGRTASTVCPPYIPPLHKESFSLSRGSGHRRSESSTVCARSGRCHGRSSRADCVPASELSPPRLWRATGLCAMSLGNRIGSPLLWSLGRSDRSTTTVVLRSSEPRKQVDQAPAFISEVGERG